MYTVAFLVCNMSEYNEDPFLIYVNVLIDEKDGLENLVIVHINNDI